MPALQLSPTLRRLKALHIHRQGHMMQLSQILNIHPQIVVVQPIQTLKSIRQHNCCRHYATLDPFGDG
jgi:hypothetical protein